MAQTLNPNISYGTYVADGIRSGPYFDKSVDRTSLDTLKAPLIQTPQDQSRGAGILLAPFTRQTLRPSMAEPAICAFQEGETGYGTLLPTAGIANPITTTDKKSALAFDYPRVPVVIIAGGNNATPLAVQINGTDYRNQYMTMVIGGTASGKTLQNEGDYGPLFSGNFQTPNKAFKNIESVYLTGTVSADVAVFITISPCFGFNYRLMQPFDLMQVCAISSIGGIYNDLGYAALPAVGAPAPLGFMGACFQGIQIPSTPYTDDVRGTYFVSNAIFELANPTITFSYMVMGGDPYINQLAAEQVVSTQAGGVWKPLNEWELYGVQQYYSAEPLTLALS